MIATPTNRTATPIGSPGDQVMIRPAETDEAADLFRLISDHIDTGHLLPRPLGEVVLHAPRFVVATVDDRIVGCAELCRLGPRVAEVRSLVVSEPFRGQGIGQRLIREMRAIARRQGFPLLCAFTHDPRAFVRLGFSIVPHPWVPEKVAADCTTCVWFRRCRQYAVVLDLRGDDHDDRETRR